MSPVSTRNVYAERLSLLNDHDLTQEAITQIRKASFDKNDPWADAHWKIDFIYDECTERGGTLFQDACRVAVQDQRDQG